jgi:outer membrane lipoprotein-sorting protein
MTRRAIPALALCLLPCLAAAQDATEILKKVEAAYSAKTPLDIEWQAGYEHRSGVLESTTRQTTRMAQSAGKTRLEEFGNLSISDGVHNWQYNAGFNEYAQNATGFVSKFAPYTWITRGMQSARMAREETLIIQGDAAPCYVIELERPGGRAETYWIDKTRYLVLKSAIPSPMAPTPGQPGSTTVRVTQVTRASAGTPLPDSLFEFRPPPGAKLVDAISSVPRSPLFGKPLPDFEWQDEQGTTYSTRSLAGRVAILRFAPVYNDTDASFVELLYRALAPKGVTVWNIVTGRTMGLQDEVQRLGYTMPMLLATPATTTQTLGFSSGILMGILALDKTGNVIYHSNGLTGTSVQADLVRALRDAAVW